MRKRLLKEIILAISISFFVCTLTWFCLGRDNGCYYDIEHVRQDGIVMRYQGTNVDQGINTTAFDELDTGRRIKLSGGSITMQGVCPE